MIMTVEELKSYIDITAKDPVLEAKLQALELLIRKYTNNNFQDRSRRFNAEIKNGVLQGASNLFAVGDTVEISESLYNNGLNVITKIDLENACMEFSEPLADDIAVLVTKVRYPMDVKLGVANMLKWDIENRDKVGIQSETLSRHSVTYFNMDGDNSIMGYPKSLLGFLKPYMKARF